MGRGSFASSSSKPTIPRREAAGGAERWRDRQLSRSGVAVGTSLRSRWRCCRLRPEPDWRGMRRTSRKLAVTFPDNWWKVAIADSRCGSEHLERVRRVAVAEHVGGRLLEFEPTRPWDIVFRQASKDQAFWSDNVDRPALQIGRRRVCPPRSHTRGRDGGGRQEAQGGKKRQRKEARQINIFQPFRETLFFCVYRRSRRCSISKKNLTCASASVTTKGR